MPLVVPVSTSGLAAISSISSRARAIAVPRSCPSRDWVLAAPSGPAMPTTAIARRTEAIIPSAMLNPPRLRPSRRRSILDVRQAIQVLVRRVRHDLLRLGLVDPAVIGALVRRGHRLPVGH